MRALTLVLVAVVALAAAPADAKRGKLRGSVRAAHGKAPKRWSKVTKWVPAAPTPAPSPSATPTPTSTPDTVLPESHPRSVSVASTEFALTLSQTTVAAGTVRVEFDNSRAEDPHRLAIDGPDPDYWSFDDVPAGAITVQRIEMRPGRHVLFCPLPEHEERGMSAVLTVR